tara:strand:- start:189 stop:773 length:585 start_codon:yes stop_codon:yes gene_type:complete
MYLVRETLPMIAAVFVLCVVSLITYDENDVQAAPVAKVTTSVARPASFYEVAHKETQCLATNIYFEARGESHEGKKAVAFVTLNRVESPNFPDNICDVVYQAQYSSWWKIHKDRLVPIRNKCQFSWYCDGKSDHIRNNSEYESLYRLASEIIVGKHTDNTKGAEYYHAYYVEPEWKHSFVKTAYIGDHIFYSYR